MLDHQMVIVNTTEQMLSIVHNRRKVYGSEDQAGQLITCAAQSIYSSHDTFSSELKPSDTTHTRCEMDEQDRDNGYSEPC